MTKKKLIFIIPTLDIGGAEKVTMNILRKMDASRNQIKLIVLDGNGPLKNIVPKHVELIVVSSKRLRYAMFKISRLLVKNRPDYIFSTIGHLNLALIFIKRVLLLKSKIIIREASTPSKYLGRMNRINSMIYYKLYRYLYPQADKIVAQCDSMKKDLVENMGIPISKIVRIYNPIDIEDIKNKADEYYPREYNINTINIISVGRLVEAKGYDTLLKAFKILVENNDSPLHLYIVGEGPKKVELTDLSKNLKISDKVSFLGFMENPYPYIKSADLFVLSSKWEGFPNTLLEALACGKKVVATDCESGPKEILGEEQYGLLANVDDPLSLSEKIKNYLSIENKNGNRAEDFNIQKIIKQYEMLFRQ